MHPRKAYSTAIRPELMSPVAADLQRRPVDGSRVSCASLQGGQQAQVAVAQVGSAVGDAAFALEDAIGVEQPIGVDDEIGRVAALRTTSASIALEVVVVEAVEELEPDSKLIRGRSRCADQAGHAPEPVDDRCALRRPVRNPPASGKSPSRAASARAPPDD